ncbi:MAG: hypothetical protein K9J83_00145 [Desulfarculaceae bacterium]|nr:hypothetical protein [Desulfarculaceae bacterium]
MRNYFLTGLFLTMVLFGPVQISRAADANEAKQPPSPNWTHPKMRKYYQGYEKIRKKKSSAWQYKTNRRGGNIRGGGTTEYEDYRPFYQPYPVKGAKRKNRNKR